jgi:hypothetical protein
VSRDALVYQKSVILAEIHLFTSPTLLHETTQLLRFSTLQVYHVSISLPRDILFVYRLHIQVAKMIAFLGRGGTGQMVRTVEATSCWEEGYHGCWVLCIGSEHFKPRNVEDCDGRIFSFPSRHFAF